MSTTKNLKSLFKEVTTTTTQRELPGTLQVNQLAKILSEEFFDMLSKNPEEYRVKILEGIDDNLKQDAWLLSMFDNERFKEQMTEIPTENVSKILRSQQSKRSHAKAKVRDENGDLSQTEYTKFIEGCYGELLLRQYFNLGKRSTKRTGSIVEYTEDELLILEKDQWKLRAEIRNLQAKKSLMKKKENFTEDDIRWKSLLVAEEKLKACRQPITTSNDVITGNDAKVLGMVKDMATADISSMNSKEMKELLKQFQDTVDAANPVKNGTIEDKSDK